MPSRSALPIALLLSGCFTSATPAVLRNMTEQPADHFKQHEQQESSLARPSADSRKPLSKRMRQVETAAATVASFVGVLFSTSENVILGTGGQFEEMGLFDPNFGKEKKKEENAEEAKPDYDASQVVPWLRFDPPKPK